MTEQILSYGEASAEVLHHAREVAAPAVRELVPLDNAPGRVLAENIVADRDQPPFQRSTRDGYAVRSQDLRPGGTGLRVLGLLRAGERWQGEPVEAGQAIEIMTGAPLPAGADCVLMVEHATAETSGHMILPDAGRTLTAGENTVPAGAEARAGTVLVSAGRRIGVPEISLAASCGYPALPVYARPEVAVVATGDELVEVGATPAPWQIRNSNTATLAALIGSEGGRPLSLTPARDTRDDLEGRLAESRGADLLLLSGGVSMGKYDLVEEALRAAGAEFFFTGARIQPGKPVVFGRLPAPNSANPEKATWTYFLGLPGNPVSTEVCFRLFVAPMLRALAGETTRAPRFAEARLLEDVRGGAPVTRFLPATLQDSWEGVTVRPVPWQGSGDLAANGRADAFVVLPTGVDRFPAGETVRVLLR